ncbi:subtilase family protein [Tamilnaduibacter salinus]|uniref:Subtilase family protein n=1 Tax=Tamilnaduibacter salinus TaxID=1484056 RepID=A0A2U1CXM1_9GAMM|nr:S8 family serine peptidase [Tamilnaduibacter salinus]PVY76866.1 subtilase family protein [Tamilnaduibacter salinus]
MKQLMAAALIATMATNTLADESVKLRLTLAPGAESVGDQVDYATTVQFWGSSEIVSVDAEGVDAAIKLLERREDVENAERTREMSFPDPQPRFEPMSTQTTASDLEGDYNDPLYDDQYFWASFDANHKGASSVAKAVANAQPYDPMVIAVIDSGFHDIDSFDWKGGYNFLDDSNDTGGLPIGPEFITSESDGCDAQHGQQVASVLGGAQNDGAGNTGVLADARFYGVRALDCIGSGTTFEVEQSIRWAIGQNLTHPDTGDAIPPIPEIPDLINISISAPFVSECPSGLQDAINDANAKGVVITVGSGNNSGVPASDTALANCNGVLAVGATIEDGSPANFTTRGPELAFSAAGVNVPVFSERGSTYIDGTSFSSPLSAAIIGNLWQDIPALTSSELKSLAVSAVNVPDTFDPELGAGILDAAKLQKEAVDLLDPPDFELRHPLQGNCGAKKMLGFLDPEGNEYTTMREVKINADLNGDYAVIFETDESMSLSSAATKVVKASQQTRVPIRNWNPAKEYGIQKCTETDGTGCDSDALIPLDMEGVELTCPIG